MPGDRQPLADGGAPIPIPDVAIADRTVDEAVTEVMAAGGAQDPGAARRILDNVTDAAGVVTREAADDAVGHVATVVATPETRVELAEGALADARDAAAPVADSELVATRLDRFEARLDDVRVDLDECTAFLAGLADDVDEASLWSIALDVEQLESRANQVQHDADELAAEIEAFENWVTDHDRRLATLRDDCDAITESVAELDDAYARAVEGDPADPADAWADASLRTRLFEVLVVDLRYEFETVASWADRGVAGVDEASDGADLDAVRERIDGVESRLDDLAARLDDAVEEAWVERNGEVIKSFEDALEAHEPPLDPDAVRDTFAEHRESLTAG